MREFTYTVQLEGTYKISNLLPGDTNDDFYVYEPVKMSFCSTSIENPDNSYLYPFQVTCGEDTTISSTELLDVITGNLKWRLCVVDIDWRGLKLTLLYDDRQITTCRLTFSHRVKICFTTTNNNCEIIH